MDYKSAVQHGLDRWYVNSDGTHDLYTGGNRSWRNNNPGNLADGNGAIGYDNAAGTSLAIFPDYQTGLNAQIHLLQTDQRYVAPGVSINTAIDTYTNGPGRTAAQLTNYQKAIIDAANKADPDHPVDGNTDFKDLTDSQFKAAIPAFDKAEGYREGTVTPNQPANSSGRQGLLEPDETDSSISQLASGADPNDGTIPLTDTDRSTLKSLGIGDPNADYTLALGRSDGSLVVLDGNTGNWLHLTSDPVSGVVTASVETPKLETASAGPVLTGMGLPTDHFLPENWPVTTNSTAVVLDVGQGGTVVEPIDLKTGLISYPGAVQKTINGNTVTIITPTAPDSTGVIPPSFAVI